MKRSQLKRGTKQLKRTSIKRVSVKHGKRMREYSKLRKVFMEEHPVCQCCERAPATDCHHRRKRGIYYLVVSSWMAVCRHCHSERIHGDPANARKQGWII